MPKIYCDKCGTPYTYSLQKPNFCTSCGNCLNKSLIKSKLEEIDEEAEDIRDEINFVPNISNLELDISFPKKNSEKISDLVGTGGNSQFSLAQSPDPLIKKEDVIKNFQQEAGAIRPRNRKYSNNAKQK